MCIGIYVPKGVANPKKTVLKRCFAANSDGAGFGWYDTEKKKWIIEKGHMTWKAFWRAFNAHQFDAEVDLVLHFRIGTSGKREHPDCTHPFPVTDDYKMMMEHNIETDSLVLHNGVIGQGLGDSSDTMVAIKEAIDVLGKYITDEKVNKLLGEMLKTGSNRWLIANGERVFLYGTWEEDKDTKIYYSNDGYKEVTYMYQHGGAWEAYDAYQDHMGMGSGVTSRKTKTGSTVDHPIGCPWADFSEHATNIKFIYMNAEYKRFLAPATETFNWNAFSAYLASPANLKVVKDATEKENMILYQEKMNRKALQSDNDTADIYLDTGRGDAVAVCDMFGNIVWDSLEGSTQADDRSNVKTGPPCPNCKDDKHLVTASTFFNVGDTMCCRCGCVYLDSMREDRRGIVEWDVDIRKQYEDNLKTMTEG
jgi:hypothetical protein